MEIWRDIEGYEGLYQVSTWGNVRNSNGNLIKPQKNSKGYLRVDLIKDGERKHKRINRLVAMAFIPNVYGLPQVNHKDGNKENNSYTNLEWTTNEINSKHSHLLREGQIF